MGKSKAYKVREHQLYTVFPRVWKKLKRENRIPKDYKYRALKISLLSRLFVSGFLLQRFLYAKKIRKISLDDHPPLFILGLWRTGTTHLHYLMANDSRFGYLKNHQAFTFNFSLLSLDRLNKILNIFVPGKRPQDNVRITLDDPAEEEQALCTTTTRSSIHSFFFPQNRSYFEKYHLFQGIIDQEKAAWKRDYMYVLKNIAIYSQKKNLLLKNPHNTGRVKELLELFPEARFIYIHRDPVTVFNSTKKLYQRMISSQFLQACSEEEIEKIILDENAKIQRKYLSDRELIPAGNLIEIAYSDLEAAPMETVKTIYKALKLDGFEEARPSMKAYLNSVKDYRRNTYPAPSRSVLKRIQTAWSFWMAEFGYQL